MDNYLLTKKLIKKVVANKIDNFFKTNIETSNFENIKYEI